MDTLIYLVKLFACLIGGMVVVILFRARFTGKLVRLTNMALTLCLYALLFSMGVRTGLIDDIGGKLSMMGSVAVTFAVLTTTGSALCVIGTRYVIVAVQSSGKRQRGGRGMSESAVRALSDSGRSRGGIRWKEAFLRFLRNLQDPMKLVALVIVGGVLAALTPVFSWFTDDVTSWLLYVLLFLVGMQMILGEVDIVGSFKDPLTIALPAATITGTLLASCLVPFVTQLTLSEALAVGSGFGWYSLSGVLIADMGNPVLGSIAFLSNLFRESVAFMLIPLLAGYGRRHAAVSVAGATSMDVTLPILEQYCGAEFVPLALAHGVILTAIVPFLVPLFLS